MTIVAFLQMVAKGVGVAKEIKDMAEDILNKETVTIEEIAALSRELDEKVEDFLE
jgi:hypothetical protein